MSGRDGVVYGLSCLKMVAPEYGDCDCVEEAGRSMMPAAAALFHSSDGATCDDSFSIASALMSHGSSQGALPSASQGASSVSAGIMEHDGGTNAVAVWVIP